MELLFPRPAMLKIASLAEPAALLIKENFAFLGSEVLAKIFVEQKLLEPVGELTARTIRA